MKFGSRVLRKIIADVMAEAPPRSLAELDHLERPRTKEAALLLAFGSKLDHLPLEGAVREFVPAIRRVIEDTALECETVDGAERRAQVATFIHELRSVLA